jgi:hypothetical protein
MWSASSWNDFFEVPKVAQEIFKYCIAYSITICDTNMVLQGRTRFIKQGERKIVLYIPIDIVKDSRFPFKGDEELFISVDPDMQSIFVTLLQNVPITEKPIKEGGRVE